MEKIYNKEVKALTIFASDTVHIDRDLNVTRLNLSIVAPNWVIMGDRKINLDGAPGKPHSDIQADDYIEGLPGLPGGAAGNFFGVGETFTCIEKLTISACGGRGGPGQIGGRGHDGKNGEDGVFEGDSGKMGEKGKDGGAGGLGGNDGEIIFYCLNQESKLPKQISNQGEIGEGGRGGEGGDGGIKGKKGFMGKFGKGLVAGVRIVSISPFYVAANLLGAERVAKSIEKSENEFLDAEEKQPTGNIGKTGGNTKKQLKCEKNFAQSHTVVLQSFKEFVEKEEDDMFQGHSRKKFLAELNRRNFL